MNKQKKSDPGKKSTAAKKLGGQPENDQDARDAGATTAAEAAKPKKSSKG